MANKNIKKAMVLSKKYFLAVLSFFLLLFLLFPQATHAMEPVWQVLKETDGTGAQIKDIWKQILNVINLFIIILLIAVAFSQILRINLNTYGIKKILPALVLAIVAANFSYLFCRLMIDFANIIMALMLKNSTDSSALTGAFQNISGEFNQADLNSGWKVLWFLISELLVIAGAILILILAFLFFIRNWLIYFLVVLSPLAFFTIVLPQTKSLFNQWWSNFMKWTFMPVVSVFWIWLGSLWFGSVWDVNGEGSTFMAFFFAGICFYLAITTPFKMGGAVMSAWGNLGKKVTSPVTNFAKEQASLMWSKQAASKKWYNPLGHIARAPIALDYAREHRKKLTEGNYTTGKELVMRSRLHKGKAIAEEHLSGPSDIELAKAEILNEYYDSKEGKEAAKNIAEFQARAQKANAGRDRGLAQGKRTFRESQKGQEEAAETLRRQKDRERLEGYILAADKDMTLKFDKNSEYFDNDADKDLNKDYFAIMTRNKQLDEAVSQSTSGRVEKILEDQNFIENIRKEIGNVDIQIEKLNLQDERMHELDEKRLTGKITEEEQEEWQTLSRTLAMRQAEKQELRDSVPLLKERAREYVEEQQNEGYHHLDGFVDEHGEVVGFAGTIDSADPEFRTSIGKAMMTRAGKLMSIEIKADVEKLLDRATISEIAQELKEGTDKFTPQAVEHFKNGRQYENKPSENREIEAHLLALARVAKQNNHAESPTAKEAEVSMLSDRAAVKAAVAYNEMAQRRGERDRIDITQSPESIRRNLESKAGGTDTKQRTMALAATGAQRNVGSSDNAASYLSGGSEQDSASPSETAPQQQVSPEKFKTMTQSLVLSQGYNPNLAGNPEIARQLEEVADSLRSEKTSLAREIGKQVGLNMADPKVRKNFTEALLKTPAADPKKLAEALNPIISQLGGKELSPETSINIQGKGGEKTYAIDRITRRVQMANKGVENAKIIALKPELDDMRFEMSYFGNKNNPDQAEASYDQLQEALEGESGVRSPEVPADQIEKKVNDTLKSIGLIPKETSVNYKSKDAAISALEKARDAAFVASRQEAYKKDDRGKMVFNLNQAYSIAAKEKLKKRKT